MPVKLTQKQEAFARAVVEIGNQGEAYRRVYAAENMTDNSVYVEACRLMQNPKVAHRVDELRAQAAQRHEITLEKLTEMLAATEKQAEELQQPGARTQAIMGLAKLHGLIVDQRRDLTPRDQKQIDAELRSLLGAEEAGEDLGASEGAGTPDERDATIPTVSGHGTA